MRDAFFILKLLVSRLASASTPGKKRRALRPLGAPFAYCKLFQNYFSWLPAIIVVSIPPVVIASISAIAIVAFVESLASPSFVILSFVILRLPISAIAVRVVKALSFINTPFVVLPLPIIAMVITVRRTRAAGTCEQDESGQHRRRKRDTALPAFHFWRVFHDFPPHPTAWSDLSGHS